MCTYTFFSKEVVVLNPFLDKQKAQPNQMKTN